jgi:hypothetical protein
MRRVPALITRQSVEGVTAELDILEMTMLVSACHPETETVEAKRNGTHLAVGGCLFIPPLSRVLFIVIKVPEASLKSIHGIAERLRHDFSAAETLSESVELV